MKHTRIIVTHYGGPDALQVLEEECPEPKDGEVRVRVLAAGVSLPDVMAREGVHPETPKVPFTPGWELAGVVDRLGPGVAGVEIGQVVAALPIHGAYAQFVCLPQHELIRVPPGVDPAEAVRRLHAMLLADLDGKPRDTGRVNVPASVSPASSVVKSRRVRGNGSGRDKTPDLNGASRKHTQGAVR